MQKESFFLKLGIINLLAVAANTFAGGISIIPKPEKLEIKSGEFLLTAKTQIILNTQDPQVVDVGEYLSALLEKPLAVRLKIVQPDNNKGMKNVIKLLLSDKDKGLGSEGYSLSVKKNGITINAANAAGLFYGVQTLRQLLPPEIESGAIVRSGALKVPCVKIKDKPRYSWRGMHLDVCRHFFPKEFIKRYIDLLAMHKMNVFHWHLTEDQGWRIEIKKYPKLTEIGAWRVNRENKHWKDREPQKPGEKATYGGFYTQDDIREIVAYAKKRFITIVPEIEMPGHAVAALASYPQFSCTGGPYTVLPGGYWPITDIYCAGKDETFDFLEDVLSEVIELFPGKYIHIGGDEANKANWKKCPDCQARIKKEGLKNEEELQSYSIRRIEKFLNSKGKTLIGWDEILQGGLAPNATVMSWRGMQGGIDAAKAGHDVVMTPTSYCYFDYYQSKDRDAEPLAIGGYLPLEKVYSFEPTPPDLDAAKAKHILGAQGNVWTEYIPTPHHVEYMALPRMSALAEVVWSPKKSRNWDDFQKRMQPFYERLANLDVFFRVPPPAGMARYAVVEKDEKITLRNPAGYGTIRYTTDDSDPSLLSPVYRGPFEVTDAMIVKAKTFMPDGNASPLAAGRFLKTPPGLNGFENGIEYKYFEGNFQKELPDFAKLKPVAKGRVFTFSPADIKTRQDHFALQFDGYVQIDADGDYTYYTTSDDGSKLFIDGKPVVDNNGSHGKLQNSGSISLTKGMHAIRVNYFQNTGGQELDVQYEGAGVAKQTIPVEKLFHKKK